MKIEPTLCRQQQPRRALIGSSARHVTGFDERVDGEHEALPTTVSVLSGTAGLVHRLSVGDRHRHVGEHVWPASDQQPTSRDDGAAFGDEFINGMRCR